MLGGQKSRYAPTVRKTTFAARSRAARQAPEHGTTLAGVVAMSSSVSSKPATSLASRSDDVRGDNPKSSRPDSYGMRESLVERHGRVRSIAIAIAIAIAVGRRSTLKCGWV
jgi:hypothetical protein